LCQAFRSLILDTRAAIWLAAANSERRDCYGLLQFVFIEFMTARREMHRLLATANPPLIHLKQSHLVQYGPCCPRAIIKTYLKDL
jgi:hypothetical protein